MYFQEALRNILIVFAKLNPGIRYVQGMNEILAPLFYVFRSDPDEDNAVIFLYIPHPSDGYLDIGDVSSGLLQEKAPKEVGLLPNA